MQIYVAFDCFIIKFGTATLNTFSFLYSGITLEHNVNINKKEKIILLLA